jgi:hypothetical protein
MQGEDSLEQTIREENTPVSLPVVTISDGRRMVEKTYRERCAVRLLEIVLDLDNYRADLPPPFSQISLKIQDLAHFSPCNVGM